jgi:hypothetical protein
MIPIPLQNLAMVIDRVGGLNSIALSGINGFIETGNGAEQI